jgi:predicted transcriptional regulator
MKKSSKAPIKNDLSENMMRASIVLEKDMHETLRILSFVMDRSVSDMAREALTDWLARNEDVAKFAGAAQKLRKTIV